MITKRTKGFTLVEILIVVIILGILAAIIIPQFTDASQDARRSSVMSNMQALRSQFELYRAQHLDVYPWDDGAGDIDADADIETRLTTKTDSEGAAGGNLGPYMQKVPTNPFAAADDAIFGDTVGDCHWLIDTDTGAITDGTGTVVEN